MDLSNPVIYDEREDEGVHPPRVSIAIPVYNGARFLSATIESILSQTYPDFELIICDNASTDATGKICQAFVQRDSRVRYYRNEQNIGWAGNHNKVIDLAHGVYFKWAAHDDLLDPTFIEKCVRVLDEDPEVVLCYPRTQFIDERGNYLAVYADGLDLQQRTANRRFSEFFNRQSLSHPVFGVTRRHVLLRTGRMGSYVMSDRVLIGEMALNGQIYELPETLFLRRLHDEISTNVNSTSAQMLAWINPKAKAPIHLHKWRRLFEYYKAVQRAPMSTGERLGCYGQLIRFIFIPRRWAGLFQELATVIVPVREKSWMK
jgi:glycosyltransferase involved in cell wall biosynthesis